MAYTFSGSRYVTKGVAENFPIELQAAFFSAIEQMREKVCGQLDYLQIFEIVTEGNGQKKWSPWSYFLCQSGHQPDGRSVRGTSFLSRIYC